MTYVTAGYPTPEETVDIMLGMEAGGAGEFGNPIDIQLLIFCRHNRARFTFHGPNCGWTNNPEGKYCMQSSMAYATYLKLLTCPKQALLNGVTVTSVLAMVREARKKGLKAPVLFMGYYNPMLSYGEERLLKDCLSSGVNGFIIVDLPPEEAITFRNFCTKGG